MTKISSYAIEQNTDDIVVEAVAEALGGLQEARRLRKLNTKGSAPNFQYRMEEFAEELFLSLNYLEVDIDEFTDKLLEVASEYD